MSTISHTNINVTFRGIILNKGNTIVDKQEVSLFAIETMIVQIVFRLLTNKNLCYPNTMFSMAHIFFTKSRYAFITKTQKILLLHTYRNELTVCWLGGPTRSFLNTGASTKH
jgi:hypothetical protein